MIAEAIKFANLYHDLLEEESEPNFHNKRILLIETKKNEKKAVYSGIQILSGENEIQNWLLENPHCKKFFSKIDYFIFPRAKLEKNTTRKAIGSTGGLLTYCPFSFNFSEKTSTGFLKKLNKHKYGDELDKKTKLNEIRMILEAFWEKHGLQLLKEEKTKKNNFTNFHVVINFEKVHFLRLQKITEEFIEQRASKLISAQKEINDFCGFCGKEDYLATPLYQMVASDKKPYLKHITRNSLDRSGLSIFACGDCRKNSILFRMIINQRKLKIFPLLINNSNYQKIAFISLKGTKQKNLFHDVFQELNDRENEKGKVYDYYLLIITNDYTFFDYVANYQWHLGMYYWFWNHLTRPTDTNRKKMEIKLAQVLTEKAWVDYFETKVKGFDSKTSRNIYSYRQKIFDFVYRNKSTLSTKDLADLVTFRVEKLLRAKREISEICNDSKRFLNLFYNSHLLEGKIMTKEDNVLLKVKNMRNIIQEGANLDKFMVKDDIEWAYWAGHLARYLISKSKTNRQTFSLLEPFINKSTTELVKLTLSDLFEKYKHAILIDMANFNLVISRVLSYQTSNKNFKMLKIPFYVGVFDDPVLHSL